MRFKILTLFVLFFCIGITTAYGQWDAQISQYWRVKTYYNPSFAGETNYMDNTLLHRRQWVGITNAPTTTMGLVTMPLHFLGKDHGVGVSFVNEKIGLFSNTTTGGQYTYKFKFKKNRVLNIGLHGSLIDIDFDAGKIHIPDSDYHDPSDPSIPTSAGGKTIDGGLGVSWVTPHYWVGFSAMHLWEPKFDLDDNRSAYIARTYYLMGGYNIQLADPLIVLQPSAFVKTDAVTYQVDITARAEYNKMFNGGISWRKDDGFVFLLGVKIKNIDASYSYDLSTSAIAKVSSGSHELSIRYSLPLGKKEDRHGRKSVRIL